MYMLHKNHIYIIYIYISYIYIYNINPTFSRISQRGCFLLRPFWSEEIPDEVKAGESEATEAKPSNLEQETEDAGGRNVFCYSQKFNKKGNMSNMGSRFQSYFLFKRIFGDMFCQFFSQYVLFF